jgi:hypothetical protein
MENPKTMLLARALLIAVWESAMAALTRRSASGPERPVIAVTS